jgi:hypothetical protein
MDRMKKVLISLGILGVLLVIFFFLTGTISKVTGFFVKLIE